MVIDMSESNPATATPLNNFAVNNIDSVTIAATPSTEANNDNNVSSARNILADYYAAILNRTPAVTPTFAATNPFNELVAATNSVTNNNDTAPVPAFPAKRNDFANVWGSFMIPSVSASNNFISYDDDTCSDDEDLTWEKVFNTYEFSYLCSREEMVIEKQNRKRKASNDDNKIPFL
jgi:hypothetical protein